MTESFHRFPRTPHLFWLGKGSARQDKILSPEAAGEFLAGELVVEEKVDGANLGLSLGPDGRLRAQSRGHYLAPGRSHSQWNPLWPWLAERRERLAEGLQGGLMLFGEWCYARHTVPYDALPDWFLAFDIYEVATDRFWTVGARNQWLKARGIFPIPELNRGNFSPKKLLSLPRSSRVGHAPMEGLYLRCEQDGRLVGRAKIVRAAFKLEIEEHWTRRPLRPNQLLRTWV